MGSCTSSRKDPMSAIVAVVGDISFIDENLYLGDHKAAKNISILKTLKITSIVQLIDTNPDPKLEAFITYLHIPIHDGANTDITPVIEKALIFMHEKISKNEVLLVHCWNGRNRSASIVISYIMASKGLQFEEALDYVEKRRPILVIHEGVKQFLIETGPEKLKEIMMKTSIVNN